MNNIFDFATNELSQDAFICWFFNWFNDGDNPRLKQLVCDFCKDKLGVPEISSVDIHRQFTKKSKKGEEPEYSVKIDVLVILNNEIAVIIEDKTYTSEHSDQISRYKEGLKILQEKDGERKLRIGYDAYSISNIMSVYWKTGFFYDYDKIVETDIKIDSDNLLDLLKDYRNEHQLIDMYVQKLLDGKKWYVDHARYWKKDDDKGPEITENTNLCKNQIAQYTLMRELFPETMWDHKKHYYVYHGSSFGRPWTEITVYCNKEENYECAGGWFEFFWRIDTDSKGSYISLRLYKMEKGKWDSKYDEIKSRAMAFIESNGTYQSEKIDPGNTKSYKEADIVHFTIDEKTWKAEGEQLKRIIRELNEDILDFVQTKYGSNGYET